ncbi:MAG: GNAT family N-acetyltransferase [Candidatus Aenigmarchaeota archaeon]|nr:GNAT family N-acetyltransferase [Candidatus Aenigmarchaeota archaeon]
MKFKEGKIIETFHVEKNGKKIEVVIRYPKKSDLMQIWKFYNKAIRESEGLSRYSFVPLKDEKKWVGNVIDGMKKRDKVQLMAEAEGKIIGSVGLERKNVERKKHCGDFGIAILQDYTGLGIGKKLMTLLEKDARSINIKLIELGVYGRNKIAQKLYKKMGFKVAGKIPKCVKTRKGFDDDIIMYKVLKK